jgi:hypothetical protein
MKIDPKNKFIFFLANEFGEDEKKRQDTHRSGAKNLTCVIT